MTQPLQWPVALHGLLRQANAYLGGQQVALAVPLLQQALTQVSDKHLRQELLQRLARALVKLGRFQEARSAIALALSECEGAVPDWLGALSWRLSAHWWAPAEGLKLRVRRPEEADASWLKACFSDEVFGAAVNREYALRIKATPTEQIAQQLGHQLKLPPADLGSVLLVVERLDGAPLGIASFVNLDEVNRRAEFIIGFPGERPHSLVVFEAGLLLAEMAFVSLGFHKVTASVYADNPRLDELTSMLGQLGFSQEGVQREHVRLPDQRFIDVHLWGALGRDVLGNPRMKKYARRFLGRIW